EPLLQKGRKRKILLGDDALRLLAVFGIPSAVGITVRSWRGIEAAAAKLSRPLVLKLSGEDFLHKSEWGGVATGINSKKELRESWRRMKENVRR
ncbi:MAG TPA: acetate--CoA ligase family protein, partial [Smithellaceae bacterium]|nr:acetate--CoA ligase family protein [Smithellaceae bacterium]